jgi:hypothetical protein
MLYELLLIRKYLTEVCNNLFIHSAVPNVEARTIDPGNFEKEIDDDQV